MVRQVLQRGSDGCVEAGVRNGYRLCLNKVEKLANASIRIM